EIGDSSYASRTTTFAANYLSPPTVVISKKIVSLPDLTILRPPFSTQLVFDVPWAFLGNNGLAWRVIVFQSTATTQVYVLRAVPIPDRSSVYWTPSSPGCIANVLSFELLGWVTSTYSTQSVTLAGVRAEYGPYSAPTTLLFGTSSPNLYIPGLCA